MSNKYDSSRMTAQQLKNSILQMAVQGKLVPQDPNDEPASLLLEKIRAEKAKLVKEKKIKADKNESFIYRGADNTTYEKIGDVVTDISDQIPFDIPEGWEWCRLSAICTKLVDGDHNPPKGEMTKTNYIMASSTNINNDTIVELERVRYLSFEIFIKENERTTATKGDIFFTSVGSLGRSCVFNGEINICFQRSVSVISTLIYNCYLKRCFDSDYIQMKVNREATGTAQKGFYLNQLAAILIPLPPLSEQHRIVAKIEELLPYIDRYDEAERKLTTLNNEFPDKLKKSILQMAVQGKLVPQNPDDEPASVLLEKIRAEKERLIKQGKIKRDKSESAIYHRDNEYYEKQNGVETCISEQIPFEIPEGWEWCRLGDVVEINPRNKIEDDITVSFIPMTLITEGYYNLHTSQNKLWKDVKSGFTHFAENDVAFAKITPCFENRKSVILKNLSNGYGAGTTELHILRVYNNLIFNEYLLWFCKSAYFIDNGVKAFSGTAGQ